MRYWLLKTEPNTFSWDDLMKSPDRTTCWEGVRNYQARNLMRDEMTVGDQVLIYHSVVKPMVIAGVAEVVREAYPDHFAWEAQNPYFDAKSSPDDPRWVMVDVRALRAFEPPITRNELKAQTALEGMMVLKGEPALGAACDSARVESPSFTPLIQPTSRPNQV